MVLPLQWNQAHVATNGAIWQCVSLLGKVIDVALVNLRILAPSPSVLIVAESILRHPLRSLQLQARSSLGGDAL